MARKLALTDEERTLYEWQMWVPDFGEKGQEKLKGSSALVSRCGGVGGAAAYYLAAAGVGRLVLAHGGYLKPSDLNRQILMTQDWIGKPRIESAARRLKELNPRLRLETVPENISASNAERLVEDVDVVVDCAPLFEERFAMNAAAVRWKKPLVECAMYELEAQLMVVLPGRTPCLACLYPEKPAAWKRQFPVFGAVAGAIGSLGALEALKLLAGMERPLTNGLLHCDLRNLCFKKVKVIRNPRCRICGHLEGVAQS